jgi:hypothetical protein
MMITYNVQRVKSYFVLTAQYAEQMKIGSSRVNALDLRNIVLELRSVGVGLEFSMGHWLH